MKSYKIDEIGKVVAGGTPSTKISSYWDGNISWITPKDLSNFSVKYITHGERNISEKGLNNSSAKLIPKNSVLLSSRAPIGYIAIASKELATNQGFKNLICNESICHYEYFYYWLKLSVDYIIQNSSGSTFKEISASSFKNLEIQLPSLKQQYIISHILKKIDKKIETNTKINNNLPYYMLNGCKTFSEHTEKGMLKEYH